MTRTMILEPLSETDLDENVAEILKKALERIRMLLDSIKADETQRRLDSYHVTFSTNEIASF